MTGTFSFNFLYECEQFTETVRPSVHLMFNVFSEVEEEAAEEIIEKIEEDVYDDDSEVEPEDEEAKLKTQEKDLVTLKAW